MECLEEKVWKSFDLIRFTSLFVIYKEQNLYASLLNIHKDYGFSTFKHLQEAYFLHHHSVHSYCVHLFHLELISRSQCWSAWLGDLLVEAQRDHSLYIWMEDLDDWRLESQEMQLDKLLRFLQTSYIRCFQSLYCLSPRTFISLQKLPGNVEYHDSHQAFAEWYRHSRRLYQPYRLLLWVQHQLQLPWCSTMKSNGPSWT